MNALDLEPILHSPRLPDIAAILNDRLHAESERRARFYDEMTDAEKVEFIDGEVVMHSPARNRHMLAKQNLTMLLNAYVIRHDLGAVRDEKCLCVFPRNDYEPDIVFFEPIKASVFDSNTMKFPVPDFVVEILSDTTEYRDRGVKFEDFEAHGVREYWIIDADEDAQTLEQYVLVDSVYELRLKSGSGEVCSQVVGGFRIPISAIFDPKQCLAVQKSLLL